MAQLIEDSADVAGPSNQVPTTAKKAPRSIEWKYVLKGNGKATELKSRFSGLLTSKSNSSLLVMSSTSEKSNSAPHLGSHAPIVPESSRMVITALTPERYSSSLDVMNDRTTSRNALKRANEETNTAKQLSAFISANACLTSAKASRASTTMVNDAYEETSPLSQNDLMDNKNDMIDVTTETDNEELDANGNIFPEARERTLAKPNGPGAAVFPVVIPSQQQQQQQQPAGRPSDGRQGGEKPFFCEKCGLGFEKLSYFTRHMKGKFHSLDSLECDCDMCSKRSEPSSSAPTKKDGLSKKVYTCEVCGEALNCPLLLRKHMCVHTSKNMCTVCGKKFMLVHKLHEHMLFHTGENKCDICGKTFMRSVSLEQHMFVHKDQKPYSCDICGKQFICEGGFKRHQYVHKQHTAAK